MGEVTMVSVAELGRMVESIFMRAGFTAQQADAIARIITAAERDGAKSHGIYRIEGCLRTLAAGKV
ncbi:Ldh family oxidoreductase, partial [Paracoccus sp. PXZ]